MQNQIGPVGKSGVRKPYVVNRNILRILTDKECTHGQIARRIGVSPSVFSNIIHCKRAVYADEVVPIALALGCSIEELFREHT